MITITGSSKIFLHLPATDLRKGFESLGHIVQRYFDVEVTSGAFFVFLNRRRDKMKVLYWDTDGFAIWYKRLERGTFSKKHLSKVEMSRKEFFMLLEGIIPKRIHLRHSIF